MNFAHWFARKLVKNHSKFLIMVIIALTFGLTQRIGVNLLLTSIQSSLVMQSKTFLLGDLEVKSSKPLTVTQNETLEEKVPSKTQFQKSLECLSIAISSENSKTLLVSLKAVDQNFPLYGDLVLMRHGKTIDTKNAILSMQSMAEIWVDQSLKITLNLSEGSRLRLGNLEFIVKGFITAEPGQGIQGFSFGPRVYIGYPMMEKSGLIQEGSRLSYLTLLKLPNSSNPASLAHALRNAWGIKEKNKSWMTPFIQQEGLQITTHFDKAKQWLRLFTDLGNYFSLLSMILLMLSCAAVGTMIKGYIEKNLPQYGILEVLGAQKTQLLSCIAVLLGYLFLFATGIGFLIGLLGYFAIKLSFSEALPLAKGWIWMIKPIMMAIFQTGILTLIFAALPIFFAWNWTTLELLNAKGKVSLPLVKKIWLAVLATVILGSLMWIDTHAFWLSFTASILLSGLVGLFYLILTFLVSQLPKWSQNWVFYWQFGINNLYRFRSYMVFAMTSLSIGLCCLCGILIYKNAVLSELNFDRHQRFPDLFLVGIYDTQKDDLNQFFYQWSSKLQLEPLIKARLSQHNGEDIKKIIHNDPQREALINREQNLSFRENLGAEERLDKGEWMKGYYQVEASLEEWYAKTLGISLGDRLTFEIQGVSLEAKVTSIRKVKWTTFTPNFFVLISQNALKDAPKEWLGTVSGLNTDALLKVQAQLSEQFPSVTVIPVKSSVDKIKRILNMVFHAITLLSLLSIISGVLTLISVLVLTFTLRIPDINVLKILGFQYPAIRLLTLAELVSLTGICFVLSNIVGATLMAIYIRTQTNLSFKFSLTSIIVEGLLLEGLAAGLALFLSKRLYKTKPKFSA